MFIFKIYFQFLKDSSVIYLVLCIKLHYFTIKVSAENIWILNEKNNHMQVKFRLNSDWLELQMLRVLELLVSIHEKHI